MSGHGHVIPNADGSLARCGGPGICAVCSLELSSLTWKREEANPVTTKIVNGIRRVFLGEYELPIDDVWSKQACIELNAVVAEEVRKALEKDRLSRAVDYDNDRRRAVAEERERCIKAVCEGCRSGWRLETSGEFHYHPLLNDGPCGTVRCNAAAIKKSGSKEPKS